MRPFISPNWHVVLIHFPLALISMGLLIELFSFLWRKSTARVAGRWMILIGTIVCVPAAINGIYALRYAARPVATPEILDHVPSSWIQTAEKAKLSDAQWEFLHEHILFNSIGTGIMLFAVVAFLAFSDRWRRTFYPVLLIAALAGLACLTSGAWHGGETVYRHGTSVEGNRVEARTPMPTEIGDKVKMFAPPPEVHTFLAGIVVALAAVAFGLTLRAGGNLALPTPGADATTAQFGRGDWTPPPAVTKVPSARFWLIAALLAIGTAVAGYWYADNLSLVKIKESLGGSDSKPDFSNLRRNQAHVFIGVGIVVLLLVMSLLAKAMPRKRIFLSIISLILFAVVAAQVWIGTLMLLDGNSGPFKHFKNSSEITATQPASTDPERAIEKAPEVVPTPKPDDTKPQTPPAQKPDDTKDQPGAVPNNAPPQTKDAEPKQGQSTPAAGPTNVAEPAPPSTPPAAPPVNPAPDQASPPQPPPAPDAQGQ